MTASTVMAFFCEEKGMQETAAFFSKLCSVTRQRQGENHMRKAGRRKTAAVCAVLAAAVVLSAYAYWWAFHDIQRIAWQEILTQSDSPSGRYTVTAYLTNGGATTDFGVLCGVTDHMTGGERKFYWQYRCEEARILWLDDETVQINGIVLDVQNGRYDYRHDQSIAENNGDQPGLQQR